MHVLVVVQRYLAASEPWIMQPLDQMRESVVGVAGRTVADPDAFQSKRNGPPFFRLRTRNLVHRVLPKPLRRFSPWSGDAILSSAIRKTGADRVLCHFGNVALEHERLWDRTSIPLFVHFHGYDATFDLREPSGSGVRVHPDDYQQRIVKLSKRAKLIANSQHTRRNLIKGGVAPDRIVLKYLGVPIPEHAKIHQDHEWPIIVTVGRLVDFKGVDLTVKAFEILRSRGTKAKLRIVGEGIERPKIEAAIRESGFAEDIELKGWVPNVELGSVLGSADVYTVHNCLGAHTHQEEALNVSVLEAMALGLPVVGTDSGGVQESVVAGECGLIGPSLDVEVHADNLQRLLSDWVLRQQMGTTARNRVRAKFSVEREVLALQSILE